MVIEIQLFESTNAKALRMLRNKVKLLSVNIVLILMYRLKNNFLSKHDKSVTFHNKYPQIPNSVSIHSVTRV